MEHENDGDINCCWCTWNYSKKSIVKGLKDLEFRG